MNGEPLAKQPWAEEETIDLTRIEMHYKHEIIYASMYIWNGYREYTLHGPYSRGIWGVVPNHDKILRFSRE